jgi:hypothetical protein
MGLTGIGLIHALTAVADAGKKAHKSEQLLPELTAGKESSEGTGGVAVFGKCRQILPW